MIRESRLSKLTRIFLIMTLMIIGCAKGYMSSERSLTTGRNVSVYNILDYGAVGDGKTMCTKAIQSAVDACAKVGGGMVYVPAGEYQTGPIFLKSNINFHISEGATLLGSKNFEDYPGVEGRWEGIERTVYASLLTGHNLNNVSITGRGTIDGQGEVWWKAHEVTDSIREAKGIVEREPDNPPESPLKWPRPRIVNLYNCENVLIRDLTILNSPVWTIHPVYCKNITVENITIIDSENATILIGLHEMPLHNINFSNIFIKSSDDGFEISFADEEEYPLWQKRWIPEDNELDEKSGNTYLEN